jgi:hypothetical protein
LEQPSPSAAERRHDRRQSKAFAFWVRPEGESQRISAWMLDIGIGGAAFLTASEQAPPVGQRLELYEMLTRDRLVREDAAPLPPFARVIRHDPSEGVTRRIAVRFEADAKQPTDANETRIMTAAAHEPQYIPLPPPVEIEPGGQLVPYTYPG